MQSATVAAEVTYSMDPRRLVCGHCGCTVYERLSQKEYGMAKRAHERATNYPCRCNSHVRRFDER